MGTDPAWLDPGNPIPAHEESARALRRHNVLVPAESVKVAVQRAHIDRNCAVGLGAVQQYRDTGIVSDVDQRSRRQPLTGPAADMADRYHPRAFIQQSFKLLQHLLLVMHDLKEAQLDTIAPHVAVPRDPVARMLLVAQDYIVTRLPIDAIGHDIDADGRVLTQHDLIAVSVHRLRDLRPRRLEPLQHLFVDTWRRPSGIMKTRPAVRLLDHRLHLRRKAAALKVGVLLRDGSETADVGQLHCHFLYSCFITIVCLAKRFSWPCRNSNDSVLRNQGNLLVR